MADYVLRTRKLPLLLLLSVSMVCTTVCCCSAGSWWTQQTEGVALDAPALATGATIEDDTHQPVAPLAAQSGGLPTIASGAKNLTLKLDAHLHGRDTIVRFRMNPDVGGSARLVVSFGAYPVTVSTVGGTNTLEYEAAGAKSSLQLCSVYQRSLNYSDRLRRQLDDQMTSQIPLNERWLSVRMRVTQNFMCEFYIEDVLVARRGPVAGGLIGIGLTLSPGVEIASVHSRVCSEGNIYEPVRIDSSLNSSGIAGAKLTQQSLPAAGRIAEVQGQPFVFPQRDFRGNDHIDLGASWVQSANLEGDFPPNSGLLGGRWTGPAIQNPSRIQFQLPKGRYNALHLICAADGEADNVPVVTAQFFRAGAGRPESFSTRVPLLTAKSSAAVPLPVTLSNGKPANLYLVTIPVDPGALAVFDGLESICLELTKEVQYFRCYPDPSQFSVHGAGLPSSVHVYAMTLERPGVSVEMRPGRLGHTWVAPERPVYSVKLRNLTNASRRVSLQLKTRDYYGKEITVQKAQVTVPASGEMTHKFTLAPKRYGYHDVTLVQTDEGRVWAERQSMAYLHPDTRERGDWKEGRGPIFGFWPMSVVHDLPPMEEQTYLAANAGAEAVDGALTGYDQLLEKLKIKSYFLGGNDIWVTRDMLNHMNSQEEAETFLANAIKGNMAEPSSISDPKYFCFFAEPSLGPITTGIPPDYYGEDYTLSPSEQANLDMYAKGFVIGARYIKKHWPHAKCLMPYGDPIFPVYFLRQSKEVRELIDGMGVDIPAFERLAETQIHQLAIHRCWVMREEFRKAGIKDPILAMVEGPAVATHPCSLSLRESADNTVRLNLLLYAHGINKLFSSFGWECNGYYGEQHYGSGGMFNRMPLGTPRPSYPAFATMTRHLNRKNLQKWLPTGSLSTYALQFKHHRTGGLTEVFWTVRGRRPVTLTVPGARKIALYDQMDNVRLLALKNGKVTFTIDQSPCYVEGLVATPKVLLGAPDHSDAMPAPAQVKRRASSRTWATSCYPLMSPSSTPPVARVSKKLGNLGDGRWNTSKAKDETYANNSYLMVARYPGNMSGSTVKASASQGGKALAVGFGKQAVDRFIMPYYTSLLPAKPITIPGKPSHLGLWVRGASDWGRVVYCLRDAEGERWISIGARNDWNCDDTHSASFFCFDGWRYLRFETPANSPYDQYRELGSTWWGHYGGDGLVNLPLRLEKVIVERRTHAMYVNDPRPTKREDVLLGDLYAEYESPEDRSTEAIRLNRVHMPVPEGMPDLSNPVADLEKNGSLDSTEITRITVPTQDADGTKCFVFFKTVENAKSYDIWVSAYQDGRGAFKLGSEWSSPGQLITGLRQDTDFYAFVVYRDKDGRMSKPSNPFKIRLQDVFGMK